MIWIWKENSIGHLTYSYVTSFDLNAFFFRSKWHLAGNNSSWANGPLMADMSRYQNAPSLNIGELTMMSCAPIIMHVYIHLDPETEENKLIFNNHLIISANPSLIECFSHFPAFRDWKRPTRHLGQTTDYLFGTEKLAVLFDETKLVIRSTSKAVYHRFEGFGGREKRVWCQRNLADYSLISGVVGREYTRPLFSSPCKQKISHYTWDGCARIMFWDSTISQITFSCVLLAAVNFAGNCFSWSAFNIIIFVDIAREVSNCNLRTRFARTEFWHSIMLIEVLQMLSKYATESRCTSRVVVRLWCFGKVSTRPWYRDKIFNRDMINVMRIIHQRNE